MLEAVLLAQRVYDGIQFHYVPLIFMPNGEKLEYNKSYLWRPQKEERYGDKDVSHRRMSGAIQPGNLKGFPYPFSDDTTVYRYGAIYHMWYNGGTELAECWYHYYQYDWPNGCENTHYQFSWEKDGDRIYYKYRVRSVSTVLQGETWDYGEFGDWVICNAYYDTVQRSWYVDHPNVLMYNVEFDLLQPLPYYWLDYMESIRPLYNTGIRAGSLSEAIRNSIAENTTVLTNNFANLSEVISLINDFRKGKILELIDDTKSFYKSIVKVFGEDGVSSKYIRKLAKDSSKHVASGWLKYRYAYTTTKADVEQYTRAKLGEYLGNLTDQRVLRGKEKIDDGMVRVKMRLHDNTAPNLDYELIGLDQWGLFPGLYNLWDLIPFSFIADWGSNLGDYLQDIDQSIYFRYYKVDELLVTYKQELTRDEPWGLTHYRWYDRMLLDEMPQWEIYEGNETSAKTFSMRCVDGLSLIVEAL